MNYEYSKKIQTQKKCRLRSDVPVRVKRSELEKRVNFILAIGYCQICGTRGNIDYPHHAKSGLGKKDDQSLVNICVTCHRQIHSVGFSNLLKTRDELKEIGRKNNLDYLESK